MMHIRSAFWGRLLILLSATLLWAGDPWKYKPYTEWSPQDIWQVLNDSPWTKRVGEIYRGVGAAGPSQSNIPGADQRGERQTVTETVVGPSGQTDQITYHTGIVQGEEKVAPSISTGQVEGWFFFVRWESSLTVRQALVRSRQLKGRLSEAEATRLLSIVPPQHTIFVRVESLGGFTKLTEEAVRASAYLKLGRSKQKIPAAGANFLRVGEEVVAVWLTFPKEREGRALITPQENKVKFFCKMGKVKISAEFDLGKMMPGGTLDI